MNFKYKCKINEDYYNIQIFNIEQEKIKIMIDTKNSYSDEYYEYSTIYTLVQLQEITKYFLLFESIEEVFEDLTRTIQTKNFSIKRNGITMTLCLKLKINNKRTEVELILEKTKSIDLSSQKDNNLFYNTLSTKNSEFKNNFIEKSARNIDISNINELNNLLSDFKDRIVVLENSQNMSMNRKEKEEIQNFNNNYTNDKITQNLEHILSRLEKLELDNKNKDEKIKKLEKKLRKYESPENNPDFYNNMNSINTINNNNNINKFPKNQSALHSKTFQNKVSFNPLNSFNKIKPKYERNISNNNLYPNNRALTLTPNYYLRHNKSAMNIDNSSFHSRETQKYYNNNYINNDLKSNSTLSNYSNAQDRNFQKYIQYKERLKIQIVPREDIRKFVNSRIIFTRNELRLLKTKFTQGEKKLHAFFDLLYRASADGDYEEIVKNKVRNKAKTLTLFYSYEGARFGVYVEKAKSISFIKGKIYKEIPGTSFMVSLNNLKFFDIMPGKTCLAGEDEYLCFGRTFYLNTNGTNWIIHTPRQNFLKKKCVIGDKGSDYLNLDTEMLVGVREDYHIKDVEIFEVCLEKDYDSDEEEEEEEDEDEDKKKKKKKKKKSSKKKKKYKKE